MSASFIHAACIVLAMLMFSCTHQRAYFHNETISKQCYSGVNNSISVTDNKAIEKTHLENQIGEKFPWNDTCKCFMIKSLETGDQTFYWVKNGSNKRIDSCVFNFVQLRIPECRPNVAIQLDDKIKKDDLLSISVLELIQPADLSYPSIKSFNLTCSRSGGLKEYHSNSAQFTEDMKKELSLLKRGERFYIEQIEINLPDGAVRCIAPQAYTVI